MLVYLGSSMIISKGQFMAPVGHTASHQVHQPQFPVSMKAMTFPTSTNDLQEHTVIHRPHPLHLSWSITGISDILFNSIQNILRAGAPICM